ncbi:hypothetical protein [Sporofaciens sp. JLR.KK001]|uniref:hypothetical protein n=1 Tax=Sporofaciens sp. JLR.KK001 TaxID=3112621 RepID=UPI002FEF46F3
MKKKQKDVRNLKVYDQCGYNYRSTPTITLIILMLESHCSKASEPSIQVSFNLSEPPQYIVYL